MTKHERYLAALRCEEPDRVPIVVRGVNPLHNVAGIPPSDHPSFKSLIKVVAEKTEWAYRWHPPEENLLSYAPAAKIHTEFRISERKGFKERVKIFETSLGSLEKIDYVSTEGKPGLTKKYLIETTEDVEKFLSIPYEFKKPDTSPFFELKNKMGDNGVVMVNIGSDPIGHTCRYLGLETLAMWSLIERETIIRLLDEFSRRAELLIKALLEDKTGPVFAILGMEQATPPMLSEKDFSEFVTQYDEKLYAPIREEKGIVFVHCHGNLKKILDDFINMGAGCLHPVEGPPMSDLELGEAKKTLTGKICIEGNMQLDDFYSKDEEYIRETVKKAMTDASQGGGYVLCPTASPIPPVLNEKTHKNYLAYIEAGLEYG
jgi:hypothetical protein